MIRTCEICGDVVKKIVAAECGHRVWLCEVCKKQCPGALRECVDCEDGELQRDEEEEA